MLESGNPLITNFADNIKLHIYFGKAWFDQFSVLQIVVVMALGRKEVLHTMDGLILVIFSIY